MKRLWRVAAIAGLVVAVAAVLYLKRDTAPVGPGPAVKGPAAATVAGPLPRLLDLGATKCIPCKMMAPILEEMRLRYAGRMQVDFIDVWEDESAARKYRIAAIPTQIYFDAAGKELYRHEGFISEADILAQWKQLGFDFAKGNR